MGANASEILAPSSAGNEKNERTPEDIREEMASHREAIESTLHRLDNRIQQAVDWRSYVADHPLAALGLAAGAGFLVAGAVIRRPSPRDRVVRALADGVQQTFEQVQDRLGDRVELFSRPKSAIRGAVSALVMRATVNYLKNRLNSQIRSVSHFRNGK